MSINFKERKLTTPQTPQIKHQQSASETKIYSKEQKLYSCKTKKKKKKTKNNISIELSTIIHNNTFYYKEQRHTLSFKQTVTVRAGQ